MWQKKYVDMERVRNGEFSAKVFLNSHEYVKITNKLLKFDGIYWYFLYKDDFTFCKFRIEYGRFGKRHDEFICEIPVSDVLNQLGDVLVEEEVTLPKIPNGPNKELVDD